MADLITEMQDIMCRSCTECEANWCDGEDKQECCWMEKIAEVGQTIEKEIRNKAIDEFAERMKIIFGEGIIPDEEKIKYEKKAKEMICGQNVTFKVAIKPVDEIASQMKGEKECQ